MGAALGHYQGSEGERYFRWQDRLGKWSGIWNAPFFQPAIRPSDRVLDFGCGAGHLLAALNAGHKVGVEVNPEARSAAEEYGFRVATRLEDLEEERFDVVISCHALEHVAGPRDILVGLGRRLVGDGRLVLLLPLDDWRSREQRSFRVNDINMHLYCWTPQALGNLLRAADLEPLTVRVVTRAFPPLGPSLWRAGRPVFETAAVLAAFILRRRQLLAYARPLFRNS